MSYNPYAQARIDRRRAATKTTDKAPNAPDEIVIAQETASEGENPVAEDASLELQQQRENYRYPLQAISTAPARIIFTAHKIEPFFDLSERVDVDPNERKEEVKKKRVQNSGTRRRQARAAQRRAAQARKTGTDKLEEAQTAADEALGTNTNAEPGVVSKFFQSYDNTSADNPVGSVTLPLFKGLQFQDGVSYNVAELGVFANAGNIGEAISQGLDSRLGGAAKSAALNAAARLGPGAASAGLAARVTSGSLTAAALGAVSADNIGQSLGALSQNATRVTTAPNERTLFEKVNLRGHQFTFKMIAQNEAEAKEIKNIVKFFRKELYPEAITVVDGGPPFAYEFPNVFQIQVKSLGDYNPAFKFGRCYLEGVDTSFNSSASGMYEGKEYMEVDISLKFREISALHKGLVRDEGY